MRHPVRLVQRVAVAPERRPGAQRRLRRHLAPPRPRRLRARRRRVLARHVRQADHALPRLPQGAGHARQEQGHQGQGERGEAARLPAYFDKLIAFSPDKRPDRGSGAVAGEAHPRQGPDHLGAAEAQRRLPVALGHGHRSLGSGEN